MSLTQTDYGYRPVGFTDDEKKTGWHYIAGLQYVHPPTHPYSSGDPCQQMCWDGNVRVRVRRV